MAKPELSQIYGRLNGVKNYHPFSAQTFADWASEAGDTVRITQNGTAYDAPVHKQSLVWRGKQQINMESGGKQERAPIEKVSNRKLETSAGTSAYRSGYGGFGRTQEGILYELENPETGLAMRLSLNEELAELIYTKTGISSLGKQETLMTRISQNAENITLEARRAAEAEGSLAGMISVEAGKISQVVSAVGEDGKVTAASIILAINRDKSSSAIIIADHIQLDGNTTLKGMLSISSGSLAVNGNIQAGLSGQNYVRCTQLQLVGGGGSQGVNTTILSAAKMSGAIAKARVNGNTLELWTVADFSNTNPSITFKKATSITQSWNSGNKSVKATAEGSSAVYYNIDHRFNVHNGQFYVELIHTDGRSTMELANTGKQIKLGKSGSQVQIQDGSGRRYANTPVCNILLQSKYVNSNGTVTPDPGYDGLSSVVVDVPASTYASRRMVCTSIEPTYPGSSTSFYTFRLEGNYAMFSVGGGYDMYRPSWY